MQRTPSEPTKIVSTPTKTASTTNIDLCCFVARQIFVANLRTFLVYNLQAKKCSGIQKMTNIRYAQLLHADHKCGLHHWILLPCNRKSSAAIQKVLGQRFTLSGEHFTFTFYWLPDGRSSWTGKRQSDWSSSQEMLHIKVNDERRLFSAFLGTYNSFQFFPFFLWQHQFWLKSLSLIGSH